MGLSRVVMDAARPENQIAAVMTGVFEPRLIELGLGVRQIADQDLEQLRVSLQLVDDIIARPESFGTVGIAFSAERGAIVARPASEGTMTIGVLSLALQRKLLILERIRALTPAESLLSVRSDVAATIPASEVKDRVLGLIEEGLRAPDPGSVMAAVRDDLAAGVPDSAVKDQVLGLLDAHAAAISRETVRREAEAADAAKARTADAAAAAASLPNPLDDRIREQQVREQRSDMYRSWFTRETVASAVGPIVMLSLVGALITAMFVRTPIAPVISDSFLLVLGYFFGNTTAQGSHRTSKKGGSAPAPKSAGDKPGSGDDDGA